MICKNKDKKKDSVRKIIGNNMFALKWMFRISPFYVCWSIAGTLISDIIVMLEHTFLVAYIINCIQYGRPFSDVLAFLLPIAFIIMFNITVFTIVRFKILVVKEEKINREIRMTLYKKAAEMDIISYDDPQYYNDFIWAMTEAPRHFMQSFETLQRFLGTVAVAGAMGVYMLTVDPIGIVFVAFTLGFDITSRLYFNKRHIKREEDIIEKKRKIDYVNRVFYLADFAKDLRLSNMKEKLFGDFESSSKDMEKALKKHAKILVSLDYLIRIVSEVLVFNGVYLSYLLYNTLKTGVFGYGTMVALFNSSQRLKRNIQSFTYVIPEFQNHSMYIEKLRRFLEKENSISDTGTLALPKGGSINLKNITFSYPKADNNCLKDISLTIKQGEKVAIVGYNGAGKSTLIKLLMRLYDPTGGELTYDGRPVKDYPVAGYRGQFATLFQDFELFAAGLGDNIKMSGDELDEVKALDVIEKAEFSHTFCKLHNGFRTPLTKEFENEGVNLSGGEAQKVAICRVLYSNAAVLILDEPSSALDPLSEYRLNHTIRELADGRTIIFISHRLSTTRMADRIYMMEDGRIAESGTHDELMQRKGKYAQMFSLQAEKYR